MYSIASKLSHSGTECATVLTGQKVMVTHGLGKGQLMSLEDWLILADGNEITVAAKAPKRQEIPVGTKFRWGTRGNNYYGDSKDNYRVAIQTKKGFVQIYQLDDGELTQAKLPTCYEVKGRRGPQMFASYDEWAKTLPPGEITREEADNRSAFQKKLDSPMPLYYGDDLNDMTDPCRVMHLIQRFKIRSSVWRKSSLIEQRDHAQQRYDYWSAIPPGLIGRERINQQRYARQYKIQLDYLNIQIARVTPEEASQPKWMYKSHHQRKLFVDVNGLPYEISVGSIDEYGVPAHQRKKLIVGSDGKAFKTFQEMGITKPVFSVLEKGLMYRMNV
jgi:hypothetical protein